MNMAHNGVGDDIFKNLMDSGLEREIKALTSWDGENVCVSLARAVEQAGNVLASRRARAAGSEARMLSVLCALRYTQLPCMI